MEMTPFGVMIGNGMPCKGKRLCKRVELKLKELLMVAYFLAVELEQCGFSSGNAVAKFYRNNESSLVVLDHDILCWGETNCSKRGSHSHQG